MKLDDVIKILLSAGSLALGAYLAAVRAKLTATKHRNRLHRIFYVFRGAIVISALIVVLCFWHELRFGEASLTSGTQEQGPDWFAVIVLVLSTLAAILLAFFTWRNPVGKNQFTSSELDPVVNKFSKNSDKANIRLLAGNLNFFGTSPSQIDAHPQYDALRKERFDEIQILCTAPGSNEDKMRHGKIITDMPQVVLRFYKPSTADLKVRGRIKTLGGVIRLLIYRKLPTENRKPSTEELYEALELDTAENNGALYSRLWSLIWDTADTPTQEMLDECRALNRR